MLGLKFTSLLLLLSGLAIGSALPSLEPRANNTPSKAKYPVSVERANNSAKGFGFSHDSNIEYTATVHINGVAYQVCLAVSRL